MPKYGIQSRRDQDYVDEKLIVIKNHMVIHSGGTKVKYHIDGLLSIENENDKNTID